MTHDVKKLLAGIPGVIAGVWFSMGPILQALVVLQALDFTTGFLVAWSSGAVSSDISRKGFVKKGVALLLVAAIHVFSGMHPFGVDLAGMMAGWFCVTELISITENAGRAGWPMPKFLTDALAKLQSEQERK